MDKKTWKEFQEAGLLWWVNMILHTFGWVIVIESDKETGQFINAYPARTKWRGFSDKDNEDGYIKVSKWMEANSEDLLKEAKE